MGHPVEKMKRMKLASLDVDTVPEGHYRRLEPAEVAKLVRAVEHALTKPKPLLAAPKPRRAWRAAARHVQVQRRRAAKGFVHDNSRKTSVHH